MQAETLIQRMTRLREELSVTVEPCPILAEVLNQHGYTEEQQIGLLTMLDIDGVELRSDFGNHEEANDWLKEATQEHFLRKGGERWESANKERDERHESQRDRMLQAAEILGLTGKTEPSGGGGYIAVIPGAVDVAVDVRISMLGGAIKEGHVPDKVVAAAGYRKLRDRECPAITDPETRLEASMMQQRWGELSVQDEGLAQLPFEISVAELQEGQARSTFEDTMRALKDHLGAETDTPIVVYIEQPYTSRFRAVFEEAFRDTSNSVQIYAEALPSVRRLFILQDEIARRIYFQHPKVAQYYAQEAKRGEEPSADDTAHGHK